MTNEDAILMLSARVDGELTPEKEEALDGWLRDNPDGAIIAEAFRTQDTEVRRTFEERREAANVTAERVVAQLTTLSTPVMPHTPRPRKRSWWAILPPISAVAIIAFVAFVWLRPISPVSHPTQEIAHRDLMRSELAGLLTPRVKPAAPKPTVAVVGEKIVTKAGEKRRVILPDQSILYLNQKTSVELVQDRHVKLEAGEIFVEATPANDQRGSFEVETVQGKVIALGTKFAAIVAEKTLSLLVTQGSVRVDGAEKSIFAGQSVKIVDEKLRSSEIQPVRRASADLDWTRDLMIAADSPLVPAGNYDGGALVAVDPYGQEAKLSLEKYHVDVHIEDGFARTTIDQTYFNHENMQMEGTFYFPLPPDASLSRLAMYVANGETCDLMEGGMAERDYARQTYEKIRYQRRDPALLEWVDGSLFKMRVFPLEARQEKRIILSYSQKLPVLYGRTSYRFPTGHSLSHVQHWSFAAVVKGGAGLSATSPSHPTMTIGPRGNDLVLSDKADDVKVDRDVVLEMADPGPPIASPRREQGNVDSVRWSSAEFEGAKYLMLRYRPELQTQPRRERRDWVFLFEASGARDPLVARAQVEVIRSLLNNAEHDDTFAVLTVGTRIHKFSDEPQRITPENVAEAIGYLEKTHLIGALNLEQALIEATPFLTAGTNSHLVHIGGGVTTLGEQRADRLIPRIPPGTHYVGVAVGKRFSPAFMKVAAEKTGGFFTQINPDESIAWRGFELSSTLNTPRLLEIAVDAGAKPQAAIRFLPFTNALSHGEELAAVARIDGEMPTSVIIRGNVDGVPFERIIDVKDIAPNAGYLPRTWAKLEIDRLLAENSVEHRQRIIDMSKAMYVMTPYTSLLVLENEAMYKEFKVDRGRKDHWAMYPCPEKIPVVYVPDPNQPADRNAPEFTTRKPHENVVLQTILSRTSPRYLNWPEWTNDDSTVRTAGQVSDGRRAILGRTELKLRTPTIGSVPWVRLSDMDLDFKQKKFYRETMEGGDVAQLGFNEREVMQKIARVQYRKRAWAENRENTENWNFVLGNENFDLAPAAISPELSAVRLGELNIMGNTVTRDSAIRRHLELFRDDGRSLLDETKELPQLNEDKRRFWMNNQPSILTYDLLNARLGDSDMAFRDILVSTPDVPTGSFMVGAGVTSEAGFQQLIYDVDIDGAIDQSMRSGKLARPQFGFYKPLRTGGVAGVHFDTVFDDFGTIERGKSTFHRNVPRLNFFYSNINGTGFGDSKKEAALIYDPIAPTNSRIRAVLNERTQGPRYYGRPSFSNQERVFTDLAAYAPGMSSSAADIRAVLEAEAAPRFGNRKGSIDPAARMRIESARTAEWRSTVFKDDTGADFTFYHDGRGRYAYERRVGLGLIERVVCDGSTILHLYPELGIGARRNVSRFHRAEFCDLFPEVLPPADDLVYGADVKWIDANTVAIVALEAQATDGASAKRKQDNTSAKRKQIAIHLVFVGNRLAERRMMLMPENHVLAREVYEPAGPVALFARVETRTMERKEVKEEQLIRELREEKLASAPDLKPDVSAFVILPLPLRSREIVYRKYELDPNHALTDGENACFEYLNPEAALELLACEFAANNGPRVTDVSYYCFTQHGDKRPGFYTLMQSCNDRPTQQWTFREMYQEMLEKGRVTPLMNYLALAFDNDAIWWQRQTGVLPGPKAADNFLDNLFAFRALTIRWQGNAVNDRYLGSRAAERERAVAFARQHAGNVWGWSTLGIIADRTPRAPREEVPHAEREEYTHVFRKSIADAWGLVAEKSGNSYHARYEQALNNRYANRDDLSRVQFRKLFEETFKFGILPPIDANFRSAFTDGVGGNEWLNLMRDAAKKCIAEKNRPVVVMLAWQCRQLGDHPLADELLELALNFPRFASGSEDSAARARREARDDKIERIVTSLTAIEYLWSINSIEYADRLATELLRMPELQKQPMILRLASKIAASRGQTLRHYEYLEQALDVEFARMPAVFNVEPIRSEYLMLLKHYEWLADASRNLNVPMPTDLLARTVRAADRWRSLDPEVSNDCNLTAKILRAIGGSEAETLAWDYVTTPLAMKPNESAPWLSLAESATRDGDLNLADKCYEAAFAAEPTNAQILWDRAKLLERRSEIAQSRQLMKQIAETEWQPRFEGLKTQARQIIGK